MRRLTPIVFLCLPAAARAGGGPSRFVPRRVNASVILAPAATALKPAIPAPAAVRLPGILTPAPAAQEAVQEVNQALADGRIESAYAGLGRLYDPTAITENAAPRGGDSPALPPAPNELRAARKTRAAPPPQSMRPPEDAVDRDDNYKEWHILAAAFLEVALIVAIPLLLTLLLGLK